MKFSIITPCYNRADTLTRVIESILNQDYQNFELIIIDDGSTDHSDSVMKEYQDNPKIKYIKLSKNHGVNRARNVGFDNVSSDVDWVTLLDSDDEFFPQALSIMKKVILKNAKINYFRFSEINEKGKKVCFVKKDNFVADYKSTVLEEDAYGGWTATLSKKILENGFKFEERVNGFESLSWFELSKTVNCLYSREVVKLYHTDTISLTRPAKKDWSFYENTKLGNELILKNFGDDMKRFGASKNLASVLYELGKLNIIVKERKKGIRYTLQAIKYDSCNLRIFRNILLVFQNHSKEVATTS